MQSTELQSQFSENATKAILGKSIFKEYENSSAFTGLK